jgi:tetratricopeptide (TPR) repeat protein
MPRQPEKVVTGFRAAAFFAAAVVVALPLWSVRAASTSSTVTESINIEGSVRDSTINNTVNHENPATLALLAKALSDKDASEEHRRQAEAKAAELAAKLGFTSAAVVEFFKILGEQSVPEEKIPARLIEVATHFAQTRDALVALEPYDPHAAALASSAKEALDSGRLIEADALLDQAKEGELAALRQAHELKEKAQEAEDQHALCAARLLASRGEIARTRLRYADAAEHFKQAAALVPSGRPDETADYLHRQAYTLYREGDERGNDAALERSIQTWHLTLQYRARARVPLAWAVTQSELGITLTMLGERGGGAARFEEAVAAYRAALEEITRARAPPLWATAQVNLGNALERLGEWESGTAHLEEAVAAYRAALEESTRARVPLQWAVVQANLGSALGALGERESGTAHLEEAVAAYRAALEESTRARVPLQWATTQTGLGSALTVLGERESGTAHLEEAVAAYRAALEESTRARVPLQWAATQTGLGRALGTLGERESGTGRLEEAVAAFRAALEESTRDRDPLGWLQSTDGQGIAFMLIAERLHDPTKAQMAVQYIEIALDKMRAVAIASHVAAYEAQLRMARAVLERLTKQ